MDGQQADTTQPSPEQQFKPRETTSSEEVPSVPVAKTTGAPDSGGANDDRDTSNGSFSTPQSDTPSGVAQPQAAVTWTASEFIAHDKSAGWYGRLVLAALVLAALVYILTKDKISTSVILVAALALGIYAARKPRQLPYSLDGQGLTIDTKYFPLDHFRSFSVRDEGAIPSISFLPLKRFGQWTTIYYDPKDENAIVDILAARLPIESHHSDAIDRFMNRIRF